ncbi:MAG: hypothetical protein E6G97_02075 [Alphaproteobacteria bacterium]|nr:MAG: hypothetical protein E6G97_02075 [Alphaproteobacteria bacterium]
MSLSVSEIEQQLATLVGMIRQMSPPLSNRPHLFLEQKDEAARFTERLRDRVAGRAPRTERSFTTPARDTGLSTVREAGRTIPVMRRGSRRAHHMEEADRVFQR